MPSDRNGAQGIKRAATPGGRPTRVNQLDLFAFQADALKPLLELGELAAGVDEAVDAGPGRVRFGVDVEAQRVARLAHGRAGLEAAAVGHYHGDLVVIRMDALLHGRAPQLRGARYSEGGPLGQGL